FVHEEDVRGVESTREAVIVQRMDELQRLDTRTGGFQPSPFASFAEQDESHGLALTVSELSSIYDVLESLLHPHVSSMENNYFIVAPAEVCARARHVCSLGRCEVSPVADHRDALRRNPM